MAEQEKQGKRGWRAAPVELQQAFGQLAVGLPGVETKKMFGCTCALIDGHMFAGMHEQGVFLKLSGEDRAAAEGEMGAVPFEPMAGRRSGTYVMVAPGLVNEPGQLMPWLERARAYAASTPVGRKRRGGERAG